MTINGFRPLEHARLSKDIEAFHGKQISVDKWQGLQRAM